MRADRAGLDTVRDRLREHARVMGGAPPVVFIDYLQILRPDDPKGKKSDKQNMDETVSELRRLSKTYQVPIVAISSLNRAAYNQAIGMDAFKESGAIEYSSDVLMGLEPRHTEAGDTPTVRKANIEAYQDMKEKTERELRARILKNRMGAVGDVPMVLDAMYGLYVEEPEKGEEALRKPVKLRQPLKGRPSMTTAPEIPGGGLGPEFSASRLSQFPPTSDNSKGRPSQMTTQARQEAPQSTRRDGPVLHTAEDL